MTAPTSPHLRAVKDALDQAAEPPEDVPPDEGDGGGPGRLPKGCPVIALGTERGTNWFLTPLGELIGLKWRDHSNNNLLGLFSPESDFLYDPETGWTRAKLVVDKKTGEEELIVNGYHADKVAKSLMAACAANGVWNPRDKVRGRGSWADDEGRLILHCGNKVLIRGGWRDPGVIDGFVYPTAPALPKPLATDMPVNVAAPTPDEPKRTIEAHSDAEIGQELLQRFRSWNWQRPAIDPMLLLGWAGCAPVSGALDWRPLCWVTGDAATGKSTLQKLLETLLHEWLIATADTTEAGIRQMLNQQSLPVAIDEGEAEEDDRRMQAVIKLARIAASGGRGLRGGADHEGHEFAIRSCFLFSSILIPPLSGADRTRMAILELRKLEASGRNPPIDVAHVRALGAAMRRRIAEQWTRFGALRDCFANALIDHGGHDGRSTDVFGTLLAMAWLLSEDGEPDQETLQLWGERLAIDSLAGRGDDLSDAEQCVLHIATSWVMLHGGGQPQTILHWIARWLQPAQEGDRSSTEHALAKLGIRVMQAPARSEPPRPGDPPRPEPGATYVVFANRHQGLARQFAETKWKSGVWAQAFARIDGAVAGQRQRIGGKIFACTMVPIGAVIDPEDAKTPAVMETAGAGVDAE